MHPILKTTAFWSLAALLCPAMPRGEEALAPLPGQLEAIDAMARDIDLAAGEGKLKAQDAISRDREALLNERHLWRDSKGLARKYRAEYSSGEDSLFADHYYDARGQLRLLVHSAATEPELRRQFEGVPTSLVLQQRIYFGKDRQILRVLYHKSVAGPADGEDKALEGESSLPDESAWPVTPVWDPEAEFKKGMGAAKSPGSPAAAKAGGIKPAELVDWKAHKRGLQVVDVREPDEYREGHLAGARLIPLGALTGRLKELDPNLPLVVYCRSGRRSATALGLLRARGYAQAVHLDGGILAWKAAGLEIRK